MSFLATATADVLALLARVDLLVPTTFGEQVAVAALGFIAVQAAVELVVTNRRGAQVDSDFRASLRVLPSSTSMNPTSTIPPMIRPARAGRRVRRTRALFPRAVAAAPGMRQPYSIAVRAAS